MDLKKILSPKTIAVVGASDSEGFGGAVAKNLIKYIDNDENVYYVNSKRDTLNGKKCYKSLLDIECDIDLVIIATNKETVYDVLRDAKKKNALAAVCYASGFSEIGEKEGLEREERLKALSKELNIPVFGPNCAGFVNYIDGINAFAFLSDERDRRGHIGIVSQSGMISLSLIDNQWTKMSYNITVGNANIIKYIDCLNFLIDDEETNVLALHIDVIQDIEGLEDSLKKAKAKNKRVVMYKSGGDKKSQELSRFHTGKSDIISNDEFNALISKYDVIRADDLEELIYIATILSITGVRPKNGRVASINLSGGEAGLVCDIGNKYNVNFPEFNKELVDFLYENLPVYAHVTNPLDMTATLSYDSDRLSIILEKLLMQDDIDIILIGYTLLNHIDDKCIYYLLEAIKLARAKVHNDKYILFLSFMSNTREQESVEKMLKLKVVSLPSPKYGFSILEKLVEKR